MPTQETQVFKLSEGLLLALASAAAYLFAFYYEKGFASVFKIPIAFVAIALTTILVFAAVTLGLLVFLFPIANLLTMLLPSAANPVLLRAIRPVFLLAIYVIVQAYLFGLSHWQRWLPLTIAFLVVVALQFVFPLFTHKNRTYIGRLEAQEDIDRKVVGVLDYVSRLFGPDPLIVGLVFWFGISFSESAGMAQALNQAEFLVTNTSPEMVVLRVYGDNLICAPFDRNTKEVKSDFVFLRIAEDPNLVLSPEEVGPLHISPTVAIVITPTLMPNATPTLLPTTTRAAPAGTSEP